MTIAIRGDVGALRDFAKKLTGLTRFQSGALDAMAKEGQRLADEVFTTKRDPYGKKWKRRKRAYAHPLLDDTGKLKGNQSVRKAGSLLRYGNSTPYAGYVDAVRPILPNREGGLPPRWEGNFKRIIELHLKGLL